MHAKSHIHKTSVPSAGQTKPAASLAAKQSILPSSFSLPQRTSDTRSHAAPCPRRVSRRALLSLLTAGMRRPYVNRDRILVVPANT